MSIFGNNSFSLIMNYYNQSPTQIASKSEIEQINHPQDDLNCTPVKDSRITYQNYFPESIPKAYSSQEILK